MNAVNSSKHMQDYTKIRNLSTHILIKLQQTVYCKEDSCTFRCRTTAELRDHLISYGLPINSCLKKFKNLQGKIAFTLWIHLGYLISYPEFEQWKSQYDQDSDIPFRHFRAETVFRACASRLLKKRSPGLQPTRMRELIEHHTRGEAHMR